MIRCPNCKNQLPENAEVCNFCGSSVIFNQQFPASSGYEGGKVPEPKKSTKGIIIAVIAVVVAIAIGVGGFFIGKNFSSDDKKTADVLNEDNNKESNNIFRNNDLAHIKKKGTLVVGVTDFAPFDYKENGEWVGFDADMAREFAEYLGVEVEFREILWDKKVMNLNDGEIDCVWNGMNITDEVIAGMDCSVPYCINSQVVVVNKDVADKYQTADACKDLKFAVEEGSAGEDMAKENGFEYTAVTDMATALMEVKEGKSDAAIIDSIMAGVMIGEGTAYAELTYTVSLYNEKYGVGFRKGSNLDDEFDKFFEAKMKDGTVENIAKTYGIEDCIVNMYMN